MSHCIVPKWNSRHHQRQDHQEIQLGEERNSNRSNQSHQNLSTTYVVPMSNNYEVGSEDQVTWEISREQPAAVALMHGHGGMIGTGLPPPQTKPHTWSRTGDTLESIVHQATFSNTYTTTSQQHVPDCNREQELKHYSTSIMPTSSFGKWRENMISTTTTPPSQQMQSMSYSCGGLRINNSMGTEVDNRVEKCGGSGLDVVSKKRVIRCGKNSDEVEERTSCAGAGAGASANNTITMMNSWNSFDQSSLSPTFKTTATINTHHHSHSQHCSENQDEEIENKGESLRSQSSTRRSRAAVVHNQSERRRRDRINEKMKDLQKLVPNASKTDKASMLDEVIEYLKQLQAQVHMLTGARTIPQMVMPFGMQQQLQMSILGRMGMGMGMGMGMFDVNMNFPRNMPQSLPPLLHGAAPSPIGSTTAAPSFVPPPFTMPSLVPPLISSTTPLKPPNMDSTNINNTNPIPNFNDAYGTFLAQQSMNMDFFNKMAALYRQQANQPSKKPSLYSRPNNVQGDR